MIKRGEQSPRLFPKRGDIYWANLSDARGYETKNTHPCVIISNDIQNQIGKRIIVAPLTSKIKKCYPFEVVIRGLTKPRRTLIEGSFTKLKSKVMLDQVRVITIKRLGKKRVGWLTGEEMKQVDLALHLVLGINFCP